MKTLLQRAPLVFVTLTACHFASGPAFAQVQATSTSRNTLRPDGETLAASETTGRLRDFSPRSNLGRSPGYEHRPPVPIWSGFYAGVHTGYGWGNVEASNPNLGSSSMSGGLVGVQLGYNWQTGNVVAGLEGDLTANWVDGHRTFGSGYDLSAKSDWTSSMRVRLGYSFSNVLVYATGGLAFGRIGATINDGFTSISENRWQSGYVIGGGIETKLSQTMSVRAEVLRYGFGDKEYSFGGTTVPVRGDETVVRGGLTMHFN